MIESLLSNHKTKIYNKQPVKQIKTTKIEREKDSYLTSNENQKPTRSQQPTGYHSNDPLIPKTHLTEQLRA